MWDINIQCENLIKARRPNLTVIEKKEQKGIIIDIAVPADVRAEEKEKEKDETYQDSKKEIRRLWKLRNYLCTDRGPWKCSAEFDRWVGKLGIT